MNAFDHDDDLRRRFHKLASYDAESAPDAGATLRAVRARTAHRFAAAPGRRGWYVAGLLGATAAVAALVMARQQTPPPLIDLSTARWVAPTDFLLDTPGSALMRTVPGFNVTPLQSRVAAPRRTTPRNDS